MSAPEGCPVKHDKMPAANGCPVDHASKIVAPTEGCPVKHDGKPMNHPNIPTVDGGCPVKHDGCTYQFYGAFLSTFVVFLCFCYIFPLFLISFSSNSGRSQQWRNACFPSWSS